MSATPSSNLGFQNFFSATLTGDITASSTDILLDAIPNSTEGFLVIEPDSTTNREVIFYTSKTALKVVCPSAADGRGQDDTTATSHSTGATVIMAPVSAFYEALQSGQSMSDSVVGNRLLALGTPVQTVSAGFSAVATGTTLIPVDDTIPQITEGTEFMTLSITPKSATNILVIQSLAMLANSATSPYITAALFQDSTANALNASIERAATASDPVMLSLQHTMVAGTTSATTFRIRAGASAAGTTTFNGQVGNRFFGAITKSSIIITEYKAA